MSTHATHAAAFRALHVPGRPLVLFNAWDAGSARAVAAAGAAAIATGSWSVAAANGYEDGEQVPLDFALANIARIVAATALPVSIDLERGYGSDADAVGQAAAAAIRAGAVGCNIEDSLADGGQLRDAGEQARRYGSVRAAAKAAGAGFFINARTDVFFQGPAASHDAATVAAALARAHAYAEAGADGLFVPGLSDESLIERLVRDSPLPVNIMAGANCPPLARLAALGVARLSYGPGPYRAAMAQLEAAARLAFGATT